MIGLLLSRRFLIAAGSVATVTLTGAGGWLSGFGARQPPAPQIHVSVPQPTSTTERVTIIKPVRTITVRGPSPSPAPGGAAAPPTPGPAPAVTVTATAPAPARGCDQPPGWCRNSHTPQPTPGRP